MIGLSQLVLLFACLSVACSLSDAIQLTDKTAKDKYHYCVHAY